MSKINCKHFMINLLLAIATIIFSNIWVSCNVSKQSTSTQIGHARLTNYMLRRDVTLPDSATLLFITRPNELYRYFTLSKSSPGNVVIPNFDNQSVVAVILQSTNKVITIDLSKAEIVSDDINLYYTMVDTTSWKSYAQRPFLLEVIPKSINTRQANFFINQTKKKTVEVKF